MYFEQQCQIMGHRKRRIVNLCFATLLLLLFINLRLSRKIKLFELSVFKTVWKAFELRENESIHFLSMESVSLQLDQISSRNTPICINFYV